MKDLCKRFFMATARIENMVLLAGVLGDDSLSDVASEFLLEESLEIIEECLGKLPELVRDGIVEDDDVISQWLKQEGKYGFLVQMATPIMRPYGKSGGRAYSWGMCSTKWFYGDTLDEALEKGFSWVAEQRKKEDEKAAG